MFHDHFYGPSGCPDSIWCTFVPLSIEVACGGRFARVLPLLGERAAELLPEQPQLVHALSAEEIADLLTQLPADTALALLQCGALPARWKAFAVTLYHTYWEQGSANQWSIPVLAQPVRRNHFASDVPRLQLMWRPRARSWRAGGHKATAGMVAHLSQAGQPVGLPGLPEVLAVEL